MSLKAGFLEFRWPDAVSRAATLFWRMCDNLEYDYVPETKKCTNSVESEKFSLPKQFAWPWPHPHCGFELRAGIRRVERTPEQKLEAPLRTAS